MIQLIKHYFSLSSLNRRIKNKKLSVLCFFDIESKLSNRCLINRFTIIRNSVVDNYTYVGSNCSFTNVTIGKFCSISNNVNIGLGIHPVDFISTSPLFFSPLNGTGYKWVNDKKFDDYPERVVVGNDVWIGMNVSIMGGVKIGNGAIIGSHSLVTKDVDAYAIVGGVPAKTIRKRFDDKTIEALIKSKWWEMSEHDLKSNLDLFGEKINSEICDKIIAI